MDDPVDVVSCALPFKNKPCSGNHKTEKSLMSYFTDPNPKISPLNKRSGID
jgi:hypothetical protein